MEEILQKKILVIGSWTLTVTMVLGLLLTWFLTWLLLRTLRRIIKKRELLLPISDSGRRHSVFLIVKYLIWTIAVAVMLEIVGIHVTVLLAGSAALLVGLGLGVQQIFRDIVSGVFLLFEGTIEIGDVLQLDGVVGRVVEINLRTSELITRDGRVMIVPNHKFITENLINWSHYDQQPSKFAITVGTDYLAPESRVLEIMLDCARQHPDLILNDPERQPNARIHEFTAEQMIFELSFWTHRKFESDHVGGDLRLAIRARLAAENIGMSKK